MEKSEVESIVKKHLPSGSKFIFRGGIILLASIVIGIIYGFTLMELPTDLTEADAGKFKLGLGFGYGISLAFVGTLLLSVKYYIDVFKGKKKAALEIAKKIADKT